MRHTILYIGWIVVAFIALCLRLHNLGDNPVHFDEATGASILGKALSGENPGFDPNHFHGPLLRESSIPIAQLRGENDWRSLNIETLRLGPAIAGCLLCFTPLLWLGILKPKSALATGALLATSPLTVFYSRIYIHESWLALFGMLSSAAVYRFLKSPNPSNSFFAGVSIGLMFATKESFIIYILSWLFSGFFILLYQAKEVAHAYFKDYLKPFMNICLWTLIVSAFFYTNHFRNPTAFIDAFRTFFVYETTDGHSKQFTYYIHLLLWPKQALGIVWTEGLVALLAFLTVAYSLSKKCYKGMVLFISIAITVQLLIYSCINYKTPWLMLLTWSQVCLCAGMLLQCWPRFTRMKQILVSILFIITLIWQIQQSIKATGRNANDARNPYAYVPSSNDLTNLQKWLEDLSNTTHLEKVALVGNSSWPLPWYLRTIEDLTYWPNIRTEFSEYAVVFVMPEHTEKADRLLLKSHKRLPRGLRENIAIIMYLRNDIWEKWMRE